MPFSASTQRPESSATAGRPVNSATARALISAFSANVPPVSAGWGAPGKSARPARSTPMRAVAPAAKILASSAILCAFFVASTMRGAWFAMRQPLSQIGEGGLLQLGQLSAAGYGQVEHPVEHRAIEGSAFRGALNFHKPAVARAHHVHVRLGDHVLLVAQVQQRLAADDADTYRGHRRHQWLARAPAFAAQPADGVGQRHVTSRDRGGAGTAIGLKDVAVDHDRVLTERRRIHACAQRPAYQPGDLLGATAGPAPD